MMRVRATFVGEGKFDDGLMQILMQLWIRVAPDVELEFESGRPLLEVYEADTLVEKIRVLVKHQQPDLFFVHRDSDKAGAIARGAEIEHGCDGSLHVPVIPVRETEAWLLLDEDAIREVVGNSKGKISLDLPKLAEIEDTNNAKERLQTALRNARADGPKRRPGQVSEQRLCAQLLESLDIDGPITQLSAWQALVEHTRAAAATLTLSR
jgi:hypothetical protein